jgi:hypothetical protein
MGEKAASSRNARGKSGSTCITLNLALFLSSCTMKENGKGGELMYDIFDAL